MTIPIASIKNKIISTKKRKIIKFQNTTAPGLYTSSCEVFFYLVFLYDDLDVSWASVCDSC